MSEPSTDSLADRVVSACQSTRKFLWKHRGKIAVGGAVCAISLVAYSLYGNRKADDEEESIPVENSSLSATDLHRGTLQSTNSVSVLEPGNRSRMLLRLRKQYDIALKQFLPTLRAKILEVVDVTSAIKRIKELRSGSGGSSLDDELLRSREDMLWEEIKVSSFTLLFVSSYMVSALTVLLRVQLHILVRSFHAPSDNTDSSHNEEQPFGDDSTCRLLIEGTYKHLFGAGLHALVDSVQRAVLECFCQWSVKDKLVVEYSEFVQTMSLVRKRVEGDISAMARTIMLRKFDHLCLCL
jgi:hypothetical protein